MYIDSIEGMSMNKTISLICDICNKSYYGKVKTALRHIELFNKHQCTHCSHVRGGKKTAERMSKLYSIWYSGEGNPAKKPGVGAKISSAKKGVPFSEEHKKALCKPKSNTDKIKEAANRPEEVARRRERMLSNNPSKRFDVKRKISESVSSLMASGEFTRSLDVGFVSTLKTVVPIWCRSGLEKKFVKLCDNCKEIKSIESAEYLKIPYEFNGSKHYYLPDFIITLKNDSRIIVEIKSSYFQTFENWVSKFTALNEYSSKNGVSCFVLNEKEVEQWQEQLMQ
jgi:hypothetical protein